MEFYVGTSGWSYNWNETRRLDWFVSKSQLNAMELNASFYRYPSLSTVEKWAEKGKKLRWSIKVNRLFTHTYKFNDAALNRWKNFEKLFTPLEPFIDFYLFQLPPKSTPYSSASIERFVKKINLESKFALEVRNREWFSENWINWAKNLGITLVSVDAPDLPRKIFNCNDTVYLRVHGKTTWYTHNYTKKELEEIANRITDVQPKKAYVFFNNDTAMLDNAREMLQILKK